MKPKVFIGSSKESLHIAQAVQANLEYTAEVTVWTQSVFNGSTYILDSLIDSLNEVDFGIFILGRDDILILREKKYISSRDNIIFELGLCIGKLGKQRSFFIQPRDIENFRLPTDLLGLTPVTFDANRQGKSLMAALGTACYQIEIAMKKFGLLQTETDPRLQDKLNTALSHSAAEVADITRVNIRDIGIHLWIISNEEGVAEPVLVRKARVRLSQATPSPHSGWAKGIGVVGQCWEQQAEIILDLTNPQLQNCSEDNWNELDSELRMGLTYNEFRETTHYFKAIFAVPIVSEQEFIGCVSLNIDRDSKVPFNTLWTDNVKIILRRTAWIIELIL